MPIAYKGKYLFSIRSVRDYFDRVDGSPDGKAMIKAGFLEGTAAQSPIKIGEKAVQTAYSYLAGETVKKHVTIPVELITADNLKLYDMTGWQ